MLAMANGNEDGPPTRGRSESDSVTDDADGVDASYFVNAPFPAKRKLPAWLDHFNAKDLKILIKCSLAVWIMLILTFIDKTLSVIGQATFFGCVVLFIMPPSGVVFINVLAGLTIVLGLALGWAWGAITMKAALATRPPADLKARYAELQQSAPTNTTNVGQASGQTTYAQIAIYDGFMLDTRVSATYLCMMGLFVYFMARLRVASPKLTLVSIFSMIVADIYLTTAPLIPTFQGTIPKVMILPAAIAVGIGAVCNLLVFPRSTSGIALDGMGDVLSPMKGYVQALRWHFSHPESRFDLARLQQLKGQIVGAYNGVDVSLKFLPMDFSHRRFGQDDIASLQEPLRRVLVAFTGLVQLSITREEGRNKSDELVKAAEALYQNKDPNARYPVAHHQIAKVVDLRVRSRHPDTDRLSTKTMRSLAASSTPLLHLCDETFAAASITLTRPHKRGSATVVDGHKHMLQSLKEAQIGFESSAGRQLMDLHSHLFDEEGHVVPPENPEHAPPLLGLMTGLLFQGRIVNLANATMLLLERIVELEERRPLPRLWLPKGLQRIFTWSLSNDEPPTAIQGTLDLKQTITASTHQEKKRRRFKEKSKDAKPKDTNTAAARLDAMRKPTGRARHKSSSMLLAVIRWLTSTEGLFALRVVVVTVTLSLIAVIPSSAGFFYREKGLWAVMMAQLSLVPYASDFVSGLIIRVVATVVGGIVGLACWYIGSGSGPGNPYGLSAIMAVAILVFMWWRLWAPPEQTAAGIMLTSTAFLVVAYGWVDTHIPSYGNPGVGYNLFWRRILLVLVGFAAATIVTFFPRPPSGNKHYRRLLSEQITSIKDRYSLFVSTCYAPPSDLNEVTEREAIASAELLSSIQRPIQLTKFEFSTSNIDVSTLQEARGLCVNLNISISQLIIDTSRLPFDIRKRFMSTTGAGSEPLIADLMAVLTLTQQSLRSGESLPAVLPTPLVGRALASSSEKANNDQEPGIGIGRLVGEESGQQWVSAFSALVHLLGVADELVLVVKRAVGEGSDVDLGAGVDLEEGLE